MTRLTRRTRLLTALAAVAATVAAVLVVGPGYHNSQIRMHSGAVWLASGQTGEATLVDGTSAEVKAHVSVAEADTALTVVQRDGSAVVLNRKTGQLSSVESATEQVSPPVSVLPPSDGLVALSAPDVLHVVDVHTGTIASVDPVTLARRGEPERLGESIRPDGLAVDGRGRVWAIDDATGELVWMGDGRRHTRPAAAKNGLLTITGGLPVVVAPERGTAELLDPGTGSVTRSVRLDVRAGDMVAGGSTGGPGVLLTSGSRGELVSCIFDAGCAEPVRIGAAGAELGSPIEAGAHAVVPDYSTGEAAVVDLSSSTVVARHQLFDRPTRFELLVRDGIVFFNDPNGATAGVLNLTGDVRTITKHAENPATGDLAPTQDPLQQAALPAATDQQAQQPGLSLPGRTDPAGQPNLGQRPAASIVVSPRPSGVVGDEFELTMVLRATTSTPVRWSFGDDTPVATGTTVRHSWQRPGTFTVRATTTFANGGAAVAETTVTVSEAGAPPGITRIDAQRPRPVMGESVHFSASTTGRIDRWEWTVSRSGTATVEVTANTAEFDHRFTTPGHYTVSLTVKSGDRMAHASRQLTVGRGTLKGWGDNGSGQTTIPRAALSGVVAVDVGMLHTLALKSDGSVIAWGDNNNGQADVPAEALSGVVAIAAGDVHSLALKADGSVLMWGGHPLGWPPLPEEAKHDVVAIAAGGYHNLALKADGSVIAWGDNHNKATEVPPEAKSGVVAIAAGDLTNNVVLKADGSIVIWGSQDLPGLKEVPPVASSGVLAISSGFRSLGLKAGGALVEWGFDDGTVMPLPPPETRSGVVSFDAGAGNSLALKADGSVYGWGYANDHAGLAVPPEYSRGALEVAAGGTVSYVVLEDVG